MAKCVHLTTVHRPTDVRIFHKECRSLASAGHEVVLIAPAEACATSDGVELRAVRPARNRWLRMTVACVRVLRAALAEKADVYHFHDPELVPAGLWLRLCGKRVIYDVHEDVPKQILAKHWLPAAARTVAAWCFARLETLADKRWSGIVAATEPIAARFANRNTTTINNYSFRDDAEPSRDASLDGVPAWTAYDAVYVGAIGETRGIVDLLQAMYLLSADRPRRLALAGKFMPSSLEDEVRGMPGWRHVDFFGWQTHDQVRDLLKRCRVGVVALHALPRYVESQPVKLFEYMAAGIPVVASDFPRWREIVEGAQCGLLVPPGDAQSLQQAIEWLLDHPEEAAQMGRRGREAAQQHYSWEHEASKLTDFYTRLLAQPTSGQTDPSQWEKKKMTAKRVFDMAGACCALALLGPLMIAIALAVRVTSPGPAWYRGRRVGQHGKPFRIYKFRSMVANAERLGGSSTSNGDARITPVGRWLRRFKLDELPQLVNVLRGDMSFVGPRPEVQEYVDMYTDEEQAILALRPGITDWASIWNSDEGAVLAGSDDPDRAYLELIRPTKLRLQLRYARRHSVWIDCKILCYTLLKMVRKDWLPTELADVQRPTPASEKAKVAKAA